MMKSQLSPRTLSRRRAPRGNVRLEKGGGREGTRAARGRMGFSRYRRELHSNELLCLMNCKDYLVFT